MNRIQSPSFKSAIRRRAATPAALAVVYCLLFAVLCVLLTGCKTAAPFVSVPRNDSIVIRDRYVRDSIHVRDSIFVRLKNDTVFIDRWHNLWRDRTVATTDTVYKDKVVTVRLPPERYVPPIYRIALYLCIALALVIIANICARMYIRH